MTDPNTSRSTATRPRVTTPLDGPAAQHIDRIVGEVLAERAWDRAAVRLLVAADYAGVLEVCRG